jgi:hypothetical protein
LTDGRISPACRAGNLGHESCVDFAGIAKPVGEPVEIVEFPDMKHGFVPLRTAAEAAFETWSKRRLKARGGQAARYRNVIKGFSQAFSDK